MELYIPPPTTFLPRLPPPKPSAPPVPVVPIPDLPDVIHAPEGAYTLNKELFPSIGTPVAPLPYEQYRPQMPTVAQSMLGGAGGFIVPPPANAPPPGQTAMSFGTTVVNGQVQPAHPVKMSWVNVWFPAKPAAQERSLGLSMLGMGGGGAGKDSQQQASGGAAPNAMSGYEASVSTDSDDQPSDVAPIMEVPLAALPQGASTSKRNPFARAPAVAPNALAALPRPKTGLRSSNSTFVTRLQAADNLPKLLADRGRGATSGEWVRWGFWNLGRTFGWGEEGTKFKEPHARVTFSVVPTCHAVSPITASPDRLDIVVGFVTGDIVWLDIIAGKYSRINKGGILNNSSVISVNFDPRQPQHFAAAFADSTIMQFNLFAEDPVSTISNSPLPWVAFFERQGEMAAPTSPTSPIANGDGGAATALGPEVFEDAMMTWKNEDWAQLAQVQQQQKRGKEAELERSPWAGKNPTAACRVGSSPIKAMSYSPDGRLLAIVSEDGLLRLIDSVEERLEDTFEGYYASLNCVSWSPDSRFVAVGGQDDLISIYSPREQRLVARCQGHSAFVTSIAFDPTRGGGGGGGYRFGSVGEDAKLCLWDFTAASLHRPRHHGHLSHAHGSQHRLSNAMGSTLSLGNTNTGEAVQARGGRYHPAPPRNEVALLQPVLARVVEGNLITAVHMSPIAIVTVSRAAQVKFWQRPPKVSSKDLLKKRVNVPVHKRDEVAAGHGIPSASSRAGLVSA